MFVYFFALRASFFYKQIYSVDKWIRMILQKNGDLEDGTCVHMVARNELVKMSGILLGMVSILYSDSNI